MVSVRVEGLNVELKRLEMMSSEEDFQKFKKEICGWGFLQYSVKSENKEKRKETFCSSNLPFYPLTLSVLINSSLELHFRFD